MERNNYWPAERAILHRCLGWLALTLLLTGSGCKPIAMDGRSVDINDLHTIASGQMLRLADIIKAPGATVCALYPYQPEVAGKSEPGDRINTHLIDTGYTPDESHWALAVAAPTQVTISRYARSPQLDIMAPHEAQLKAKEQLPPGFSAGDCAPIERAAIVKIVAMDRVYLILGEIR